MKYELNENDITNIGKIKLRSSSVYQIKTLNRGPDYNTTKMFGNVVIKLADSRYIKPFPL